MYVPKIRSLNPGQRIIDSVINYIGRFLMSENKHVFVANTFWLLSASKAQSRVLKQCDLASFSKLIFPIHSSGHWWCVMIDTVNKIFGEYDSLYKERKSSYVSQILHDLLLGSGMDLNSFS